jgi:acyl carrier protein
MNIQPVRDFVVHEFLGGQGADSLTLDTPLISSGVIDSVGTLKLVLFLEETFHIEIDAQDIAAGKLDTLAAIAELVDRQR